MPRKKERVLTDLEKKYIKLTLEKNNINYNETFSRLSAELNIPEEIIRAYADKVNIHAVEDQLPPEPTPKQISPQQESVRNMLTPNRKESNKARHVTVMSEAASEVIAELPSRPVKGASRNKDCIFRQ